MRADALKRLVDAMEALQAIERFSGHVELDHYLNNEILQAAVERKFEILGEALNQASGIEPDLDTLIPDLRRIISTRNRIIHAYDAVDQMILWDTIKNDLGDLRESLARIIQ